MKSFVIGTSPVTLVFCLLVLGAAGARSLADPAQANSTNLPAIKTASLTLRSITLPHFEPELPIKPGRREFIAACASCHSPRYITMQPPFPRHQWEETVAKMVKTYGAPVDEEQIHAIVDYLMSINGTGAQATTAASTAGDDDSDSFSSTPVPPDPEPVPKLLVATNADELADRLTRGTILFRQDCSGCHGGEGRSDGVISRVLLPKPANLDAARFSDDLLMKVLWTGVPGTAMPSWRSLPPNDLSALVAYVQTLHTVANPEPVLHETLATGQTLYLKDCSACHGVRGDANTVAATALAPAPTNFKLEQPDTDYIVKVLQDGVPGTAMPPWNSKLSESDCMALAAFVRSLYLPAFNER
jgi:mono/diheme cytochrome c family protein